MNVWGVAHGEHFYVAAGDKTSRWASNLRNDPRARLRIGDDLFEVQAVELQDDADLDAFLVAARKKYDFEPDAEQRANATLFRLGPRSP